MFTGIVEEKGRVNKISRVSNGCSLSIEAMKVMSDIHLGDSIAVNGICLTVTKFNRKFFIVDVMSETWNRTALNRLNIGGEVNLERAMLANGRLGGHFVTGHVDGIGTITSIQKDGNAIWYRIKAKEEIISLIVEKCSIAIDGISLTVAKVLKNEFLVSVIPHTLEYTNLKNKSINDTVNLENDIVGKYIQKCILKDSKSEVSIDFLKKNGF